MARDRKVQASISKRRERRVEVIDSESESEYDSKEGTGTDASCNETQKGNPSSQTSLPESDSETEEEMGKKDKGESSIKGAKKADKKIDIKNRLLTPRESSRKKSEGDRRKSKSRKKLRSRYLAYPPMNGEVHSDVLRARILDLETRLQSAKAQLYDIDTQQPHTGFVNVTQRQLDTSDVDYSFSKFDPTSSSSIHNLLILSDSALPLGSFAYSNGLESFLAHHKPLPSGSTQLSIFNRFLRLSIQSVAFTSVPYVLAGFRDPTLLSDLDNDLDASTPCKVARAASIAQGQALISVWERAFALTAREQSSEHLAANAIEGFAKALKLSNLSTRIIRVNGHLAPLWGVVSLALGQDLAETAYVFLFNHAKAILSAAVRANVLGPYMAQNVLAGIELQQLIKKSLEKIWLVRPEDAGQVVPPMDLWVGRHEMLYSRIFNS